MTKESEHEGFCTRCNFQIKSFDGLSKCPNCDTEQFPCSYANQVKVSVNTHELRILCMWAENWALQSEAEENVVYAIALRLLRQLGIKDLSLTMADEFRALKDAGYNYETDHPAGDLP